LRSNTTTQDADPRQVNSGGWRVHRGRAHNWTESAMTEQNESSILIKSEAIAKDYLKYFYQIHDQTKKYIKMGW